MSRREPPSDKVGGSPALRGRECGGDDRARALLRRLEQSPGEPAAVEQPAQRLAELPPQHRRPHDARVRAGTVDPTRLAVRTQDRSLSAYGESKLANQYFAQELARRAPSPSLTSLSVHPGVIPGTELFRELVPSAPPLGFGYPLPMAGPSFDAALARAGEAVAALPPVRLAFKDAKEGSRTSLFALLAPGVPNGAYLSDLAVTDVSPAAKDVRAREALWRWTSDWLEAQRERRRASAAAGEAATEEATVAEEEVPAGAAVDEASTSGDDASSVVEEEAAGDGA